jgi:hypothetical protein
VIPGIHCKAVEHGFTVSGEIAVSEDNPYRIYVTHVFGDNEDYQRVFEFLQSRDNFFFVNCSKPENIPEAGGGDAIRDELRSQMTSAEVVLMPVAIYSANPDLVRYQIDVAQANKIPVVGLKSFGDTMQISKDMLNNCADIVDWNDRAIVNAIKKYARNEVTSDWETVEFNLD